MESRTQESYGEYKWNFSLTRFPPFYLRNFIFRNAQCQAMNPKALQSMLRSISVSSIYFARKTIFCGLNRAEHQTSSLKWRIVEKQHKKWEKNMISAYKPHLKVTRHHRLWNESAKRNSNEANCNKNTSSSLWSNIIKIKDYFPQKSGVNEGLLRRGKCLSIENIKIISVHRGKFQCWNPAKGRWKTRISTSQHKRFIAEILI